MSVTMLQDGREISVIYLDVLVSSKSTALVEVAVKVLHIHVPVGLDGLVLGVSMRTALVPQTVMTMGIVMTQWTHPSADVTQAGLDIPVKNHVFMEIPSLGLTTVHVTTAGLESTATQNVLTMVT